MTPTSQLKPRVKIAVEFASAATMGMPCFSATVLAAKVRGLLYGPMSRCT